MLSAMNKWTQKLLLWSSDSVLVSYADFRAVLLSTQADEEVLLRFAQLIRDMRVDLGHHNERVSSGTILATFSSDIGMSDTE